MSTQNSGEWTLLDANNNLASSDGSPRCNLQDYTERTEGGEERVENGPAAGLFWCTYTARLQALTVK